MRVQEIISENVLTKAIAMGAKLLGGPAKEKAAKELADIWSKEIAQHGKIITKADSHVAKELATDPKVIAAAEKEAAKLAPKIARQGSLQILKIGAAEYASKANTLAKWGITLAPIAQYNYRMMQWEKKLQSGEIDQETYEDIRRKELATMLAQMSATLVGMAVFKSFATGTKFLVGWIPTVGKYFSAGVEGATTAGAAWVAWWGSQEGREWLTWVICDAFVDLSPILGGVPAKILDTIKDKASEIATGKPAQTGGGQTPAAAPTGTTAPAAKTTTTQMKQPASLIGTGLQAVGDTDSEGNPSYDIKWK